MKPLLLIAAIYIASCQSPETTHALTDSNEDSLATKKADSLRLISEIEAEAKPAYVSAFSAVMTIKAEVEECEKGLLKSRDVVSHFNSTLGPEMGRLSTLSQVKQRLDTAGDAYVDYKFKKACAAIALEKAGAAKFESKQ